MQNAWEPQTQGKVHLFTVPTVWAGGGLEQGRRQVLAKCMASKGQERQTCPPWGGVGTCSGAGPDPGSTAKQCSFEERCEPLRSCSC